MPERVPRHFGITGAPDAWAGKGALLVFPTTAFGLYVLLTVVARLPKSMNVPTVEITLGRIEDSPRALTVIPVLAIAATMALCFANLQRYRC